MEINTLIDESANKREYFPLRIKVRDRYHFYAIVKYLNEEIGKTSKYWCTNDRPLKTINASDGQPVEICFRIYTESLPCPKEEFKAGEIATFLTLKGGIQTK